MTVQSRMLPLACATSVEAVQTDIKAGRKVLTRNVSSNRLLSLFVQMTHSGIKTLRTVLFVDRLGWRWRHKIFDMLEQLEILGGRAPQAYLAHPRACKP